MGAREEYEAVRQERLEREAFWAMIHENERLEAGRKRAEARAKAEAERR